MFKEEIDNLTKRNFKITGVPVWLIKDFKEYCRNECGDSYSVGLLQLMKTKMMYENLTPLLKSIFQELEAKDVQLKQDGGLKTFEDVEDS